MPELAEIYRITHFIRQHLVGRTLSSIQTQHDDIIYGKVGTSAAEFQSKMNGKTITGAGQQGKYFWMTMNEPPHAVMHFGMAGWLKIRDQETYYYRSKKGEEEEWPPKYWKFIMETEEKNGQKTEAAFVDFRRLARIRLVDCPAEKIREFTPLKENGPDPVVDREIVTKEWLGGKVRSKKVPIKALLLDQAVISGIGNWMGDEILYHAKIHPEQYSNTLSDEQIKELHNALHYVCDISTEVLADSEQFPEHWLFKHRWSKGKKNKTSALPSGETITFVTVGGRTSAVVPSVQKKTGPVAGDVNEESSDERETKRKKTAPKKETSSKTATQKQKEVKVEEGGDEEKEASQPKRRSTRSRK